MHSGSVSAELYAATTARRIVFGQQEQTLKIEWNCMLYARIHVAAGFLYDPCAVISVEYVSYTTGTGVNGAVKTISFG